MKFHHFNFFILFTLTSAGILASGDSLLVKIGSSGITTDEFQQRFELIPQVSADAKKDLEQKKSDLLYSLIAEKLWANEAEDLKLDTSDIMQITFKTIEKMFVRDALYKIEITDKIKITNEEKLEGLRRIYFNLDLEPLQFSDSLSAIRIYQLLKEGISFDSAKSITQSNLPAIQVKFGELRASVEDMLYNLNEVKFSVPIKSSSGWLIFNLLKKEPAFFEKRDQALMNVEEIIKQRKTDKYYDEFYGKFFGSRKVNADAALFWRITDKITSLLIEKKSSNSIPDSENIFLEVNDLEILTDSLEVIESVLSDLERGMDFRKLAIIHTKRAWTRNNGGEFGFFPITMYGDIGRIAAQMNVGDIYGPIKLPEGYSVFELIGKRESAIDTTLSFKESKEEIRKNLIYKKLSDFFIDYTLKLANKYGVTINEQILNTISVSDLNMFVYRYMGFGGRINAVPMALPFTEWVLPWKRHWNGVYS